MAGGAQYKNISNRFEQKLASCLRIVTEVAGSLRMPFSGKGLALFFATVNGDNAPSMIGSFAAVLIPNLVLCYCPIDVIGDGEQKSNTDDVF